MANFKFAPFIVSILSLVFLIVLRLQFLVPSRGFILNLRIAACEVSWIVLLLFIITGMCALIFKRKVAFRILTITISIVGFVAYFILFRDIGVEP